MSDKIPTPDLSHLKPEDYDSVYEPAEDSFLLLDALEKDLREIRASRPLLCLEVGSGSGVISTALASALADSHRCLVIATDVNPSACSATARTAAANGASFSVIPVRTASFSGLEDSLVRWGGVDILLCNPPYVGTSEDEAAAAGSDKGISAAWAGGTDGRGLTDKVIGSLPEILSPGGRCYMVVEQCNNPQKVEEFVEAKGLRNEMMIKRRAGREMLYVYKIQRKT